MRASLLCIAVAAAPAAAQLSYLGVDRHLVIEVLPDHDTLLSQSVDSHGFEDFSEAIDAVLSNSAGLGARAYASQESQIRTDYFHASGTAGGFYGNGDPAAVGRGFSDFTVQFRLLEDTDFSFVISSIGGGMGYQLAESLSGEAIFTSDGNASGDRTISGTLAAGEYTFGASFFMYPALGEGSYNFTFSVPTPGTATLLGLGGLLATRRRRS